MFSLNVYVFLLFQVENKNDFPVDATVRIFMAPKRDLFQDQRNLMIELDKFPYSCKHIDIVLSSDVVAFVKITNWNLIM